MIRLTRLRNRLRRHWPVKLAYAATLALLITTTYFIIQRSPVMPTQSVPPTAPDSWIPFDPRWTRAYISAYLLWPLPGLLLISRTHIKRYALGFLFAAVLGFTVFILYPVPAPQPYPIPEYLPYQILRTIDGPLNSIPSLHTAYSVLAWLFIDAVMKRHLAPAGRVILFTALGLWVALILYSTIATHQHWFIDIPPGILLGIIAHAFAWRVRSFRWLPPRSHQAGHAKRVCESR